MKYLLLAPAVIACSLFVAWPLAEVVRLSLTETNYITSQWVGLANYARAFQDAPFMRSVLNSLIYIAIVVPGQVGGALLIALSVMDLPKRWHDATRIVFYLPMLAAGIIISQVWRWVFHINGPLNWILGANVAWFGTAWTAIPAISFIAITGGFGGIVIIFLATALSIDRSLFDAAHMDGARPWQVKFRIVTPIMLPTIGTMALLSAISAPQIFEYIYALAPYEYTATMAFRIYQDGFMTSRYGLAAAEAIVLLLFVLGLSIAKMRLERAAS